MAEIKYIIGDATDPIGNGRKIIAHVCNDIGAWGAGFVLALSNRWSEPEFSYREWYKKKNYSLNRHRIPFERGRIQLVEVEPDILYVANMIAQEGIYRKGATFPPIRYKSLEKCLDLLSIEAKRLEATIHMPRIGCNLAGGKWEIVEEIIQNTLIVAGIYVYVYDFGQRN